MIVAVLVEQDWRLQEPGAPVYRAWAARCVAALGAIVSVLLLVPAAASAPNTKFVSKQYDYSIVLPGNSSRWLSTFARVTWSTGTISPDAPAFDTITDLRTGRLYIIGIHAREVDRDFPQESRAKLHDTPLALELEALRDAGAPPHVVVHGRLQRNRDHGAPRPPRLLHDRRLTDDQFPRLRPNRLQRRPSIIPLPA